MKTKITIINDREFTVMTADEGKIFARKHDGAQMGAEIVLGFDYSTGVKREDRPEYYEEIDDPNPPTATEEKMKEALTILGVEL